MSRAEKDRAYYLTNARAMVNVLDARLNGDGERGAAEWDLIRQQAGRLASLAKSQRDLARAAEKDRPS